ncbi:NACHT domain-containing protein [Micromonospora humidisoli]|uniref:NACHT domain-containing protein n=1 Tax=Micromonospora humidisoli TaxID=2807622 RepID=A0ABS2JCH8_9ACTN|nr:NACHT domain-containing protein [Micromonospora humidisoli]MBM7083159.1 NACHT domain-containing protein [Micromonospora humidisoli]
MSTVDPPADQPEEPPVPAPGNVYSGNTSHGPTAFGDHNTINQVNYGSVPPTHSSDVLLSKALETLADEVAVRRQRDEERSGVLSRPLPVRWAATEVAEASMGEVTWSSLGLTPAQPPTGGLDDLADLLTHRLPHRRLVILGAAGSGRTVLVTRLVSTLLKERLPGQPVPVLLPAGTWNPGKQLLRDWMAEQLAGDYPHLRASVPLSGPRKRLFGSRRRRTLAAYLVDRNLVLPVIQGLDMIGDGLREETMNALHELGSTVPLVVTSLVAPYRRAVESAERGLSRAAVVEVLPLAFADIRGYFAPEGVNSRWGQTFLDLDADPEAPLTRALRTPLLVWLARTTYAGAAADPRELCDRVRFPDQAAVENHLLDGLVSVAYPPQPTPARRRDTDETWHPDDARSWLRFLARHLRDTDTHEIAWWQLHRTMRFLRPAQYAVTNLLFWASVWLVHGNLIVTVLFAAVTTPVAVSERLRTRLGFVPATPIHRVQVSGRRLRHLLRTTSVRLMLASLLAGSGVVLWYLSGDSLPGIIGGLGLMASAVVVPVWSLHRHRVNDPSREIVIAEDPARADNPLATLRADRRSVLAPAGALLVAGATLALLFGGGLRSPVAYMLAFAIGWVGYGAWTEYAIARAVLAMRGRLPWRTMAFLRDAAERGVLRQVGAVYQFRHPRLRDRLAADPPAPPRPDHLAPR